MSSSSAIPLQLDALREALSGYGRRWPEEAEEAATFRALLSDAGGEAFHRRHAFGHFTASAWLVSADGQRILLTHHRKLARWLQLGGHADGDADLPAVALREAEEESGLTGLVGESHIFDIDRHRIPARAADPEHWHYDVRYVIRAGANEQYALSEESLDLAWRDIRDLAAADDTDVSLRRMARKWLAQGDCDT